MTPDTRARPASPSRRAGLDSAPAQPPTTVDERIVALTYRVARELGYSERASTRLCRQVLLDAQIERGTVDDVRTRILGAIRTAVGPRVDRARLTQAIDLAV